MKIPEISVIPKTNGIPPSCAAKAHAESAAESLPERSMRPLPKKREGKVCSIPVIPMEKSEIESSTPDSFGFRLAALATVTGNAKPRDSTSSMCWIEENIVRIKGGCSAGP